MLTADERREEVFHRLQKEVKPISGTDLGKLFSVSRQIIVGDIGILRARGIKIKSTARGYILESQMEKAGMLETFECLAKTEKDLEREFNIVIEYEGVIRDVAIKHSVYGEIRRTVMIRSEAEIEKYFTTLRNTTHKPLSSLTNGKHFCTIETASEESMQGIRRAFTDAKLLSK